jgi:2'-5' RNA ligase
MYNDAKLHVASQQSCEEARPAHFLHMTLLCMKGFAEPPAELIRSARAAAGRIRARPLPVLLDSSGLFGRKQHLALYSAQGNTLVAAFSQILRRTLNHNNLPNIRVKNPTPHVTLIDGCGRIETLPITRNHAWIAGEFLLVYRRHGEARHEEFGRWSFDPDAPPYPQAPEQLRLRV